MEPMRAMAGKLLPALHVALLVAAIAVLAMPSRQADVYPVFKALFLLQCASFMYRSWRMGLLTTTPGEIAGRLQSSGKRVSTGPLERWAMGIAFSTMAVATFFY